MNLENGQHVLLNVEEELEPEEELVRILFLQTEELTV